MRDSLKYYSVYIDDTQINIGNSQFQWNEQQLVKQFLLARNIY